MSVNFRLVTFAAALFSLSALAHEGMVQVQSQYSVPITADRLIAAAKARGLTVIARVNHGEGAKKAGLSLRPTELVIFGNPKVGTPMMVCNQTAGIDLPQKALIWEDNDGIVWLGYNNPEYVVERHHLEACGLTVNKVEKALVSLAKLATQPPPK
ncbi:DUF302 domain-containing protein [Enterovibrio nigricans]|uniref:Uncharacterized conserved protein, DUF302 family n=1 Tax=Enterovibrio nigricans DSM 22720 TaxID=1121868 RepID=A0A1T4VUQ6_9GAMM|nr:DUF302 domain-containing protein [Enterovibrio nigricans]PKF49325.1 DUF302 domain-containing protein [Enterovibrio nigricans]SKA68677.1 Uncharacterized conserved protein, DUF302 family [Enterovibrio nigricans DSM 22720]